MEWFEEEQNPKALKSVVLKHMFTLDELREDPALLLDLKKDVREKCESFGGVTNVLLFDVFILYVGGGRRCNDGSFQDTRGSACL